MVAATVVLALAPVAISHVLSLSTNVFNHALNNCVYFVMSPFAASSSVRRPQLSHCTFPTSKFKQTPVIYHLFHDRANHPIPTSRVESSSLLSSGGYGLSFESSSEHSTFRISHSSTSTHFAR